MQISLGLLAASLSMEATLVAGLLTLDDRAYHGIHLALMAGLLGNVVWLHHTSAASPERFVARWMAVGLAWTGVGDFVNSALSPIHPVSAKLTAALVLFGLGYCAYTVAMVRYLRPNPRWRSGWIPIALPALVVNVVAWAELVRPELAGLPLLAAGSLAFCSTIYVAMPTLGRLIWRNSGYRTGALAFLVAGILVPFSDLVLFGTWLDGNPAEPAFLLYASNWILYFTGQALFSTFPAWAITAPTPSPQATAATSSS